MEIHISVGEWISTLKNRMDTAMDGDCFCLPTPMHYHAFKLVHEKEYPKKQFHVSIKNHLIL
jgi:hypothetical protein|tara:strand:+ start:5273 stop:5458 length:186 start_codon:yes stop_codon:yes gene_type:complete